MAISLAQNAIALLIDLAERGEIDPWNVKVIEVIDRFLSKLQPEQISETNQAGRSPYETNLSESGQAFLYASMLLLLKADSLVRQETAEQVAEEETELFETIDPGSPLPPNLERKLRRRAVAPPRQNRRVTLQELIAQLNLMAAAMADPKARRPATRRPRPQSKSQAMRTIAQLAHQENLSEIAAILEQFLADYWQSAEQGENWLDFEVLLGEWAKLQPEPDMAHSTQAENLADPAAGASVHDRVGVFWALLFLSAQSKVELLQEQFYEDLKVRKLDPEVSSHSDPPAFILPD